MNTHEVDAILSIRKLPRKLMSRTRLLRMNVRNTRKYEGCGEVDFEVSIFLSSEPAITLQPAIQHEVREKDKENDPRDFDKQADYQPGAGNLAEKHGRREIGQVP